MTKLIKIAYLVILMITVYCHLTGTYAQGINNRISFDLRTNGFDNLNDTSATSYQRDSSMWVFQFGYFPHYNEVASSGYLFSLQFEKQSNKTFERGGYLIVKQTFNTQSVKWTNGISFGPYIVVERFDINESDILFKFGMGIMYSGGTAGFTNVLSIEYEKIISNNCVFSFSITQEIISLKGFFPIQLGFSIKL